MKPNPAGSTRILLPENNWPREGSPPCVRLNVQQVYNNLVSAHLIDPRGVSDPWSAALAFEWQLEHKSDQAQELLRLILLARFEGLVETREIKLRSQGPLLERLMRRTSGTEGDADASLILFLWSSDVEVAGLTGASQVSDDAPSHRVLAASYAPRWTLFPATAYQSSDGLARLTRVLTRARGQGPRASLMLDGRLEPADGESVRLFYGQLTTLAELPSKVLRDGPWRARLQELGGRHDGLPLEPLDGLIAPRPKNGTHKLWTCPRHRDERREWSTDASGPDLLVDANQPALKCTRHPECALVEGDHAETPVTLDALGIACLRPAEGGAQVVIWSDARRDPNLRLIESTPQGLTLCYRLGPRLRVVGRSVELKDVLCDPLPAPGPNGEPQATLPIRTEFLALVESSRWDAARRGWEVRLRGRNQAELLACDKAVGAASSSGVVTWPRCATPAWSGALVAAHLQGADEAALVERTGAGSVRVGAYLPQPLLVHRSQDAPAYVTFRKAGRERGALPIGDAERVDVHASSEAALVAIDFGTSNSVVSYGWQQPRPDGRESSSRNGILQAGDTCRLPHRGPDFVRYLVDTYALFTEWHERATPSPLVSTLLVDKLGPDLRTLRSALVPRDPEVVGHLEASADTRIHEDLKWQNLEGVSEVALQVYLERLLLPVFSDLSSRGARTARVAATFPLAFDDFRANRFQSCLGKVVGQLARSSGIDIEDSIQLYSESHAGMHATAARPGDYSLTIDMGGGTTDVAVFKDQQVLVAESLRIGGRVLLKALMAECEAASLRARLLQRVNTAGSTGSSSLSAVTLIESLLQAGRTDDVVFALGPGAAARLAVRQALTALLAAIVVSSTRLLQAAVKDDDTALVTVNLYLLGQGWNLFDRRLTGNLDEARFVDVLARRVGGRFKVQNKSSSGERALDRKLKMVDGALAMLRAGVPGGAEQAPVFMGLDFRLKDQTIAADTLVAAVEPPAFGTEDPGFAPVIEELLDTMALLGEGVALGKPRDVLQNSSGSRKAIDVLLDQAFQAVDRSLDAKRRFTHSPLTTLLSGPWADFWLRRA